jgi:hypothetical protein
MTEETKIMVSPNSYTINTYLGVKYLCLSSKGRNGILVYIALTEPCLAFFEPDPIIFKAKHIVNFLTLFNHIPYTIVDITGHAIMANNTYFFTKITNWTNSNKNVKHEPIILFFDIEVEGYGDMFPIPSTHEVRCISMKFNTEATIVLTTFPMDQLQTYLKRVESTSNLENYIQFDNQYDMIYYFLEECLKADRIVTFNGNSFDWHFLLSILKFGREGEYYTKLVNSRKDVTIDFKTVKGFLGLESKLFLQVPGIEHVDLYPIIKRLYPFCHDHTLETCGRLLVGRGKSGFDIKDYFLLNREYRSYLAARGLTSENQSKTSSNNQDSSSNNQDSPSNSQVSPSNSQDKTPSEGKPLTLSDKPLTLSGGKPLTLSDKTLSLLEQTMLYSKVDCDILEEIYKALKPNRLVAEESCSLTTEDWTSVSEAEGLLLRLDPNISNTELDPGKLELKKGFYLNVGVCLISSAIVESSVPVLRNILEKEKVSSGKMILDYTYILAQLYSYSKYIDQGQYNLLVRQHYQDNECKSIGSLGVYDFLENASKDCCVNSARDYDVLVVPAPSSWINQSYLDESLASDSVEQYFSQEEEATVVKIRIAEQKTTPVRRGRPPSRRGDFPLPGISPVREKVVIQSQNITERIVTSPTREKTTISLVRERITTSPVRGRTDTSPVRIVTPIQESKTASYIIGKTRTIETKGRAKICQDMCLRITSILAEEIYRISHILKGNRNIPEPLSFDRNLTQIQEALFPDLQNVQVADFVDMKIVTNTYHRELASFLTPDENAYLFRGGQSVTVYYIETNYGRQRALYPFTQTFIPNVSYYVDLLKEHLTTLNSLVGARKTRQRR